MPTTIRSKHVESVAAVIIAVGLAMGACGNDKGTSPNDGGTLPSAGGGSSGGGGASPFGGGASGSGAGGTQAGTSGSAGAGAPGGAGNVGSAGSTGAAGATGGMGGANMCRAGGMQCAIASDCCSGDCPLTGEGAGRCKGGAAPMSKDGGVDAQRVDARGADMSAMCVKKGGACVLAADCCSNKCPLSGEDAGRCG